MQSNSKVIKTALGSVVLGTALIVLGWVYVNQALHAVDVRVCSTAVDLEFQRLHCQDVSGVQR